MADLKKLTLLHSNDMHGDFLAEGAEGRTVGGVSMLSGYLNAARAEDPETLYLVAGDMFRGSVIDSEFQGISTIDVMNYLSPDAVTLGNHELDYGIAHLVFLERCAKFPIVNANIHLKQSGARLFDSHVILTKNGVRVLVVGIVTEEIMTYAKKDALLGTFVDLEEAAREVGRICNAYRSIDVDLTVLLTHIGFEADKELAAALDPDWGVDLIVGGHSHTVLEQPELVNGILVAQAGEGTNQIGRFDILVDKDRNAVDSWTWRLVPIDAATCPRDPDLEEVLASYKGETDRKYKRVLTHMPRMLTHPRRNQETECGNLFADIMRESLGTDVALLGSGSIRTQTFGPLVDYEAVVTTFPYDDAAFAVRMTGDQLRRTVLHLLRDEAFDGDHTEFYQFSGMTAHYDYPTRTLLALTVVGRDADPAAVYTVAMQEFHYSNFDAFFGVPLVEVEKNGKPRRVATSCLDVIEEWLQGARNVTRRIEGRIRVDGRPDGYLE